MIRLNSASRTRWGFAVQKKGAPNWPKVRKTSRLGAVAVSVEWVSSAKLCQMSDSWQRNHPNMGIHFPPAVSCPLSAIRYPLSSTRYPLSTIRDPLSTIHLCSLLPLPIGALQQQQ